MGLVRSRIPGRKKIREDDPATPVAAEGAANAQPVEFINHVAVAPAFRFGNIGIDLMLDAEEQASKRGARRVFGMVHAKNTSAQRLYYSIGWVRTLPDARDLDPIPIHKDLPPRSPAG
jgi:ribosomal protein S18 acetylase RimI-like enzyme